VTWVFSLAAVVAVDVLLWQGRRGRTWGLRLEPVSEPWPRSDRGGARRALAGVSPWLALSLVVLAWDLLGLDTGKHEVHLTISALTQALRPMNAAMLLVWMLVGMGYGVARARTPSEPGTPGSRPNSTALGQTYVLVMPWWIHPSAGVSVGLILPASRPAGVAFWLGVVGAAALVDQLARRSGGRVANAEELVRFITARMTANVILVLAWAYAGYHIFAH
jgi:hypothetical protein